VHTRDCADGALDAPHTGGTGHAVDEQIGVFSGTCNGLCGHGCVSFPDDAQPHPLLHLHRDRRRSIASAMDLMVAVTRAARTWPPGLHVVAIPAGRGHRRFITGVMRGAGVRRLCMNNPKNEEVTTSDTTLDVAGMTCMSSIRHVNDALRDLDGVDQVEVKLREGTVIVRHDAAQTSIASLIEALHDAGYESKARTEPAV
jgi:copper chaperone